MRNTMAGVDLKVGLLPGIAWRYVVSGLSENKSIEHQNCCGSAYTNTSVTGTDLQKITIVWQINNLQAVTYIFQYFIM